MRWQVTIDDKRGIHTVYREAWPSKKHAIASAALRYSESHPDMGSLGDDWWITRVECMDQPEIEGAPA